MMRNFTIKPVNEILIALHGYFYNRMKDRNGEGERGAWGRRVPVLGVRSVGLISYHGKQ